MIAFTETENRLDMAYRLEVSCIVDFFGCVTAFIEGNVEKRQR